MSEYTNEEIEDGSFQITPMGAAIVEAGFDSAAALKLQLEYWRDGKCPSSHLFGETEVKEWLDQQDFALSVKIGKLLEQRLCALESEAFDAAQEIVKMLHNKNS